MLNSEKLAIAAHLHVLLRRKTGRVTDTEWMASNTEYAAEIIRFARAAAKDDGHADLGEWAAKLELAMEPQHPHRATDPRRRCHGGAAPAAGQVGPKALGTRLLGVAIDAPVGDVDLPAAQLRAGVGLEPLGRRDVSHLKIRHDYQGTRRQAEHDHGPGQQLELAFHRAPPLFH